MPARDGAVCRTPTGSIRPSFVLHDPGMCGRFTHHLTWRQIVGLYRLTQVEPPPGWRERYNLAPTQDAPVIRTRDGERECAMLRWGLVPSWSKEPKAEQAPGC